MVRLIMGANGAGKTKQLIELIHTQCGVRDRKCRAHRA